MATQNPTPIAEAPRDLAAIAAQEAASPFPYWNADVAWTLGVALRTRLVGFEKPCVIQISTVGAGGMGMGHVLFQAVTHSGTTPDNDVWIARKRNSVIRFGCSTWQLHNKFNGGDEDLFKRKNGLGERAGEYAIHGGGVPVFVRGCDTPVAVAVVSGLKQWDDHQVVIEEIAGVVKSLGGS